MNGDVFAAEAAISQPMVDGSMPNERLRTVIRDLDEGRYSMPLTVLRQAMTRSSADTVAEGLCIILSDLHARKHTPIAELQILAIGFYRLIWRLLMRLDASMSLDEVRRLSAVQAAQVCYGFTFGYQPWPFPLPLPLCFRLHERVRAFLCADDVDRMWCAYHPLPLGTPLVAVRDPQLTPSANAIRNAFFAETFSQIQLDDPMAGSEEPLVADLLFAADGHPERFSFLRQSDRPQARFRVRQLTLALIALHLQASSAGSHVSAGFILREDVIACLLSPLVSLRGWLRANHGRLSVPVVRQAHAGDPLMVEADPAADESEMTERQHSGFPALQLGA